MSHLPQELEATIDAGKTGDKIAYPDPAAVPLGTDEEAAGTPVPPAASALAFRQEVTSGETAGSPERSISTLLSATAILIVVAAILIFGSMPHR
jgi:hypothetical protein